MDQLTLLFGCAGEAPKAGIGEGNGCGARTVGSDEGLVEQWMSAGAVVVVSVGRIGAHDASGKALECGVEDAEARVNAALARGAEERAEESAVEIGRVGEADAWGEVIPLGRRKGLGDSWIAGEDDAGGSARIDNRLLAENEGLKLVVLLAPGRQNIPANTVVEHKAGTHAPAILSEGADVFIANVECAGITLLVSAGDSEEEVGKVGAGLRALEDERTIVDGVRLDVDLIEMEAAANFEGVVADDAGEIVAPLEGVVDLPLSGDIDADGVVVEGDILDAFRAWVEGNDAEAAGSLPLHSMKPCEARDGPTPPAGFPMTLKSRM